MQQARTLIILVAKIHTVAQSHTFILAQCAALSHVDPHISLCIGWQLFLSVGLKQPQEYF